MERVWNALRRILPELLLILAGLLIAGGVWMIYPPAGCRCGPECAGRKE